MENNMFGGRINHPAYDLRVILAPNEFLAGPTLYTVETSTDGNAKSRVVYEDIDGVRGVCDDAEYPIPEWLKKYIKD